MAGGDVAESKAKGKGKKRKKGRRLGIRIDLTPLVDVAFLLLTFFMYTMSMSRPQTMEINLPPDPKAAVEISERNLLILRVNDKGEVFWAIGMDAPKKLDRTKLLEFLKEQWQGNPKLVVLMKIDRMGKYNMMVNLIDDMNLSGVNRFSLAPMTDKDKELIAKAQL